ncbi:MAG: MarR family transcriptional regulator [Bacteroidales bacterium]|nr:MarR family transcriptional regulator [Bacteroidales bacterium]
MNFSETDYIGKWIGISAHRMGNLITRMLHIHGFGLTHEQLILLKVISCFEGISQKDLAIKLDRDKTSIARSIDTLEKNHKVVRINVAGDKRVNNLYLTKDGHQLMEDIHPLFNQLTAELTKDFTHEETKALQCSLQKIIQNINNIEIQLHTQQ